MRWLPSAMACRQQNFAPIKSSSSLLGVSANAGVAVHSGRKTVVVVVVVVVFPLLLILSRSLFKWETDLVILVITQLFF